jgi:ornithine lipid ester-linked acyl 2-hydroxylase
MPSAQSATSVRDKALDVANHIGARLLHATERLVVRSSLVPTTPFLDPDTFGWVKGVEAEFDAIRSELDHVLDRLGDLPNFQDISADQASITDDDRWKTFFFFGYGFRSDANCERCPRTAAVLESIPGVTTAFFSILSPGKDIGTHRGPWRGVLRYHLALRVPQPESEAGIEVGGEVARWEEGRSLVFDDGYEHRAWNGTGGLRVVLFVDFVRPLRPPVSGLNRALIWGIGHSPYVRDARNRHEAWERRFDSLRTAVRGQDVTRVGGQDVAGVGGQDVAGVGGQDVAGVGGQDVAGVRGQVGAPLESGSRPGGQA